MSNYVCMKNWVKPIQPDSKLCDLRSNIVLMELKTTTYESKTSHKLYRSVNEFKLNSAVTNYTYARTLSEEDTRPTLTFRF